MLNYLTFPFSCALSRPSLPIVTVTVEYPLVLLLRLFVPALISILSSVVKRVTESKKGTVRHLAAS